MPKKIILIILILAFSTIPSNASDSQKNATNWNRKGLEALNKAEYLDAIDYFQRALQIVPDNETIKKNLALTYNNYAISLNNENKIEDAKEYLYKAIDLEKDNSQFKENLSNIVCNLAESYYTDGNYELAVRELKKSLCHSPKHITSLIFLGHIYYKTQDLAKAREIWEKAYTYDPHNAQLRQMLNKLKDEQKIETDLKQLEANYFDIRFDKEAISSEIYEIRYFLQDAYRDIGRDFNYYPRHKIPVILYTQEDFQKLRKTPDWVGGIYDGKIRLPVKNPSLTLQEFKCLIWHEYTHAVIFEITDNNCPIWFNEGLAKYEESKHGKLDITVLKKAIKTNSLIPLTELNEYFSLQTNMEKLSLAYIEAFSFVEFILDRFNFYVIKGILEHIKHGESLEKAFYEETSRHMVKLEGEWKDYLKRSYCK